MTGENGPTPHDMGISQDKDVQIPPMEGKLNYNARAHWTEMDRLNKRLEDIKNGTATKEGAVISGQAAIEETNRLEALRTQFTEALKTGTIDKELFDQRNTF